MEEDSPGQYIIIDYAVVTSEMSETSPSIEYLAAGTMVHVTEVRYSKEERKIRGRITRPAGWISLLNTETDYRWAQKEATDISVTHTEPEYERLVGGGRATAGTIAVKDSRWALAVGASLAGLLALVAVGTAGAFGYLAQSERFAQLEHYGGTTAAPIDIPLAERWPTTTDRALLLGTLDSTAATTTTTTTSTTTTTPTTTTLSTTTLATTTLEPRAGAPRRTLSFVTAETRGDPLLVKVGGFASQWGDAKVINLGGGQKWRNYRTKIELLSTFLRSWALVGHGKDIIVFVDGSDVFSGGCEPADFLKAYERIAKGSGAKIVFSAEVVCGEQDCNKVPQVPGWACEMAGGRDLNGGFWKKYAVGCKGTWNNKCSAKRDCGFWAPCSVPPAVKFLNSGVFVGPVDELSTMMDWTLEHYDNVSVFGDQSAFAMYWLDHQDRVTLDYTGELSVSLSDLSYKLLQVTPDRDVVWNTAFQRVQCLIHGNGRGIFHMKDLLKKLTGKTFHKLRTW